ncbi:hypothetical protein Tco_0865243 [Tanacetum coccineum]
MEEIAVPIGVHGTNYGKSALVILKDQVPRHGQIRIEHLVIGLIGIDFGSTSGYRHGSASPWESVWLHLFWFPICLRICYEYALHLPLSGSLCCLQESALRLPLFGSLCCLPKFALCLSDLLWFIFVFV